MKNDRPRMESKGSPNFVIKNRKRFQKKKEGNNIENQDRVMSWKPRE